MDLINLKLVLPILFLFFGYSKTQDHSNYFFQSQSQHQGRFIPSPSFPQYQSPPRNNFFPTGGGIPDQSSTFHLSSLGQQKAISNNNNNNVSPGSYHEQFLYLADEATTPSIQSSPFQFQQYQPTRNPDYFDFPPRVFNGNPQSVVPLGQSAVPPSPPLSLSIQPSFTKTQAVRPNGSTGFIPQKSNNGNQFNNRNHNTVLKQNQFLPQLEEKSQQQQNYFAQSKPEASIIVRPTTPQPNRSNLSQFNKFNNNNNQSKTRTFNSNRLKSTTSSENSQKQQKNEENFDANRRQQLPFKTSRNRFQPNSRDSTTSSLFTTEIQLPSEKVKNNRFGNNGGRTSFIPQKQSKNNQAVSFSPQRSRFSQSSDSSNSAKLNQNVPKRTVSISREPNEPIHSKSQNKITIDHNGSDKSSKINELNKKFGQKMNISQAAHDEYDNQGEFVKHLERLPLKESSVTSTASSTSNSNSKGEIPEVSNDTIPVILTSNFYLPGGTSVSLESEIDINKRSNTSEGRKSDDYQTTSKPLDYDYDYEDDYDEQAETESTIIDRELELENYQEKPKNMNVNISTERNSFIHATTFRRNFDKLTENPLPSKISSTPDIVYNDNNDSVFSGTEAITDMPAAITEEPTTLKYLNTSPITLNSTDQSIQQNSSISDDDELLEYEEEYDDLDLEGSGEYPEEESTQQKPVEKEDKLIGQQIISVVTTKSVINGSTTQTDVEKFDLPTDEIKQNGNSQPDNLLNTAKPILSSTEHTQVVENSIIESDKENISESEHAITTTENGEKSKKEEILNNSTEGYVVIASIQTSRSINGARFLPFPAIEQEEKKQPFSELEKKIHGTHAKTKATRKSVISKDQNVESNEKIITKDILPQELTTTTTSTENPIEITTLPSLENLFSKTVTENRTMQSQKTDNVTDKFPIINMDGPILTTSITKFVPNIKKFVPKTTTSKPKLNIEELPVEEFSSLLPSDYKQRTNSYMNKKKSTTTESSELNNEKNNRNDSVRSIKNYSPNQELSLKELLPKGYKLNESTTESSAILKDILSKIKYEEFQDKYSSKNFSEKSQKGNSKSTSKPYKTTQEDVSKYLPPGFNKFRQPPSQTTTTKKPISIVPVKESVNSSLLPPGYKLKLSDKYPTTTKRIQSEEAEKYLKKLLPPEFKLYEKDDEVEMIDISKLFMNEKSLKMKNTSSPSHHVFEAPNEEDSRIYKNDNQKPSEGSKVVFPKQINKRPRPTSIAPPTISNGPLLPPITIKKGPPIRATTEFTGWPTPSTTPISIEKLLEQSRTAKFDIFEYLPSSTTTSSSTTTTTSTTTTPQPPKPTQPGLCLYECDLAATIKIVDGVQWRPELLDHNTLEWKNLAREVEVQLNQVYKSAPMLKKWYKKIRIDSFNKGSVLVDYFVELSNITDKVNTLELKRLFHDALVQTPLTIIPSSSDNDNYDEYREGKGEKLIKETFMLGRFIVDPLSTDFIVIPKSQFPDVEYTEPIVPQWAIVLIVIGVGSLVFIIIFGVTVLINRHKNSKKTPTPLTADMLNELNKNHMGGIDNYGADDFYNVEDTWNENKQPIKPKRLSNSVHGSSQTNIYDSWGSNHNHGDYFYDEQKDYVDQNPYQQPHPHYKATNPYSTDPVWDAHQMYTYNTRPRYHREHYDPDF